MMDAIIRIEGLQICYGRTQAVRDLSLDIARGEIFGLLGPNGAGKSSTLACIQGLRRPNAGTVLVRGLRSLTTSTCTAAPPWPPRFRTES